MIIYIECTLQLMLLKNPEKRDDINAMIRFGHQKSAGPTNNYLIIKEIPE